ncbi:SNF1-related protein kinase regulatory subunit beta-2 isoform X1 [Lactuca sativa]|uniref:SNF1-related protein kinase regulatory subunit beta-2 isoform X1 n=1 Tax=Lactuca sativa TaxID=4236 RepID=UPI000CD98913|nr:SNF1-related protein kinase regulatory subunit beta-2 isoform X1 [Lactuca sativa]
MGNVSGREVKSKEFNQADYYMECGHRPAQVNSSNSYPAHMLHPPRASQFPMTITPQSQRGEFNPENNISIPAVIDWTHGGKHVAIEGSWDNWSTRLKCYFSILTLFLIDKKFYTFFVRFLESFYSIRELLEGSGTHFSILKVLNSGVYHYRFIVDGELTYSPDLPHESDEFGNIYNVLDLKGYYNENLVRDQETEYPSSPISSYNNASFTLDDYSEKLPEMPPLLQHMPLNQASFSKNYEGVFQKPLSANLDHLYIKRDDSSQPVVALSSSQRFRSKFVTRVLYKPFKKARE